MNTMKSLLKTKGPWMIMLNIALSYLMYVFTKSPSPRVILPLGQDDAMLFITVKSAEAKHVSKVLQVVEQTKRIRHKTGTYTKEFHVLFPKWLRSRSFRGRGAASVCAL